MNDSEQSQTSEAEPGELGLVEWVDFVSEDTFDFENGGSIPGFTLRYETYGRLSESKDNAILICHALSGDQHAAGVYKLKDRKPGWWNNMIGPGKPFDTNRFFVIASNCLGGCQGSTGPGSINPETGEPFNLDFPVISILDMVRAQKRLIDHLGISKLYAVAGGSMGGMQVLQWMIEYPDMLDRALPMATTARQSAQAIAFNEVGRSAIVQDRDWHGGAYDPEAGPNVGLAVARMMAHITYLSEEGMEDKFGRARRTSEPSGAKGLFDVEFEVESYLRYQGASFVNRFDANTYLYFTKALDRFDLYKNGKLEESFKDVKAKTLVVGFTSDWLFPPQQNRDIVHALLRSGKIATYAEVSMSLGHDSFLVDAPELDALVRAFISQ
ncbi:homoserine O-acetyltransferase MetX [Rubellicoccus peritrichatus]|uniref:Homoserine O-acetyltransferase n=1 Tax=Rubellicoccus peritrichatus TaxID=3080537 RepID=A0AAQ3LG37_9BACT|nr:homoserine O-acetyltransferase [Puniceicoccus sp. CR14]WOO43225.1 homoserine O-acetyltransferase [Puniceicoccus sp. CR14]